MTEQVSGIVHKIQGKFHEMHQNLVAEREKNASLESELRQLRTLLSAGEEKLSQQEEKNHLLQAELTQLNEQFNALPSPVVVDRDEEIDELVREIDHCIRQLKQ